MDWREVADNNNPNWLNFQDDVQALAMVAKRNLVSG